MLLCDITYINGIRTIANGSCFSDHILGLIRRITWHDDLDLNQLIYFNISIQKTGAGQGQAILSARGKCAKSLEVFFSCRQGQNYHKYGQYDECDNNPDDTPFEIGASPAFFGDKKEAYESEQAKKCG